jgi:paraquat-inducible protein A
MVAWRILLVAAATMSLALGLVLPVMRLERLYFFSDTPTILGLVAGLWGDGDWALALLVGLFSVVFPVLKLSLLAWREAGYHVPEGAFGRALPHLSKWSMIDVMLVAIAIFAAKSSGLASAVAQPGLWFYAASALIAGLMTPTSGTSGGR